MKLHPISATGIRAYCSDLITDPDDFESVYFLSVAGYQATVKGIIANLLENYGISVEIDGGEHYLTRFSYGYKFQVKKLPSGLVHAVLFPELALPSSEHETQQSFFIFTDSSDGLKSLFFRHLDHRVEIPLHPSWDEWLWNAFLEQEWTMELKTLAGAFRGYSFEYNPKELHDLLSEAMREGAPEIISCMEWKGEDGDGAFNID